MSLAAGLAEGLERLDLPLPPETRVKLLEYMALVTKWNRVYNLTAVREPEKMLAHHVLDSLAVAPHLTANTILDVGSGAGLPGIPLALARPHSAVTLLEASHKKSAFLQQAAIELALDNVDVVNARVETWDTPNHYDVVISRAFSDLAEFVSLAGRRCAGSGVLAAMKGVHPYEELAQLPASHRVQAIVRLNVPGLSAERHLVLVERA